MHTKHFKTVPKKLSVLSELLYTQDSSKQGNNGNKNYEIESNYNGVTQHDCNCKQKKGKNIESQN